MAHFIGSPGMNLLPARVRAGRLELPGGTLAAPAGLADGTCEVGFRPEDAEVLADGGEATLGVDVTGTRPLALRAGTAWGIVRAELGGHPIALRQRLSGVPEGAARLRLDAARLRVFRDGWRADRA